MDNFWSQRVTNANKFYGEWETKFKCRILENYFEGEQWKGRRNGSGVVDYNPYQLNLVYATIKAKLAGLIFQKPAFLVSARPGGQDWNLDQAVQTAELKQDVLNTLIQNPNANFVDHTKMVAKDSYTRFGVMEVGYAADWRNPQKEDPLLADHGKDEQDNPRVKSDNLVPVNERMYFKRINPTRFRVAVSDATELADHEWCGYYDFYYTKMLRKTKGIKFPEEYKEALVSADFTDTNLFSGDSNSRPDFLRLLNSGEISKVWNIWDMIEKKRLLLLDTSFETLWEGDMDRIPIKDLRWDLRYQGFYPIPPVFQWLSPQDEINEAREQMRSFRRRFTRKFQAVQDWIDPDEITKFTSGPDGIVVTVKRPDAITPIQNPEIGQTQEQALLIAKDDFYTISGNSSNIQASDRQTATASKIVDQKAQIRESAEQMDFSVFLCEIARETLVQAKEYLVEGLWIKYTTSPDEATALQEVQINRPNYQFVTTQEIDDGNDFEVDVDVMNQTPAAMQQQQQAFVTFVSLLHQFPELSMSPVLIRKAALVSGMRDERVIHQMQQVAALAMASKAAGNASGLPTSAPGAGQLPQGENGDNTANSQVQQSASPMAQETQQQLNQQLM